MADKDQYNDEYQFPDLDTSTPDTMKDEHSIEETTVNRTRAFNATDVRRNALIVIIFIILAVIFYKLFSSYFSTKKVAVKAPAIKTTMAPIKQTPPAARLQTKPTQPVPATIVTDVKLEQKVASLEISYQSARSEIASINSQLDGINANVSTLSAQISQLNKVIAVLNEKIEAQARDIEKVIIRVQPKPARQVMRKVIIVPKYYIQAVIPGRAWLIAQNGATLTVREGTVVPSYGMVKLIDPLQGLITTSSGKLIRFSQNDS